MSDSVISTFGSMKISFVMLLITVGSYCYFPVLNNVNASNNAGTSYVIH